MASVRGLPYGAAMFLGQRYYATTSDAWNPVALGPTRTNVPAPIPVTVPPYAQGNSGGAMGGGGMSMYDGGGMGSGGDAWDLAGSPVPFVLVALLLSLVGLRYIHFRSGVKA